MRNRLPVIVYLTLSIGIPVRAGAQQIATSPQSLPNVIREEDRLGIVAMPASAAPTLDGVLDDAVWQLAAPVEGFVQAEPDEGYPASERTQVWIAYDDANFYLAAVLYDRDPDRIVIADIRRDFRRTTQDGFELIIDTFGDRRNGYVFATNPAGARADEQVTNEGREINSSWDAPWRVATQQRPDGWALEMAIPFAAIRSAAGDLAQWGINFQRRIRRNNELAYWAPIPRSYALTRLSLAGNVVGMRGVRGGRDLRVTPYAAARTVRETGGPAFDENADVGVDLKYGLTNGLTLDLTVNPEFAQVEADVQRVNLTQFPQFFQEKRDFFLENSGLFYLGDTPRNTRVSTTPRADQDLLVFFSRRMGLARSGRPIGIDGGVRLTGQEGGFQVGALGLRTRTLDTIPDHDFAVVRLRRNIFASSDVGALYMGRMSVDTRGSDYNHAYGVDANIRLPSRIDWSSYFVNTETPDVTGSRYAFQTSINREGNFLHVKVGLLSIAENFNSDLSFYRRTGIRRWSADIGIRPRYASLRRLGIREMHPHIVWNYYTDQSGTEIAKRLHTGWTVFFNNGGNAQISANPTTETLTSPFTIHRDTDPIPAGRHDWNTWLFMFTSDPSRPVSVSLNATLGGLWTGTQRSIRSTLTVRPSYRLGASLSLSATDADLGTPNGEFVRAIWTARASYSFNTKMFVDGLAQYDADRDRLNVNVRFNVIHHPLSDLFIVYNEQRFTTLDAPVPGRSVIVKVTHMLAF